MEYKKPAFTFEQQIRQLEVRGLIIDDRDRARRWLSRVSYYRLSAYFLPFKIAGENRFRPDVSLGVICDLYNFDRKLRLLLLDAIERIEVGLRTAVTYQIGHEFGAFGHTSERNFAPRFNHARFMDDLEMMERDSRETFVGHFRSKYTKERHLPIWMASELLSFGALSRVYSALHPRLKRNVSDQYGLPDNILGSWLHSLSVARNICAHHSRLWNRELGVSPKLPPAPTAYWPFKSINSGRVYAILLITRHLLHVLAPRSEWKGRVVRLFAEHPGVDHVAMGIAQNAIADHNWD